MYRHLTAIWESTYKGWALGDNRFKEQVETRVGKVVVPLDRAGDRSLDKY